MYTVAEKITDYLIRNEIVQEEKREECIYSYEVLLYQCVGYGSLGVIGILMHKVVSTILFLIVFLTLRHSVGGFHMKTPVGCYLISILLFIGCMKAGETNLLHLPSLQNGLIVGNVIFVFLLAPVDHPNLRLNQREKALCRKASRIKILIVWIVEITLTGFDRVSDYIPYIVLGMCMSGFGMILGKLCQKRKEGVCETYKQAIATEVE